MATGSKRDVKMVLSVEALGQENITKLEQALRDLAATGDAGTSEFAELADQISRLGEQGPALTAFRSLSDELEDLRVRQEAAGEKATELAARLDTARSAAAQQKDALQQARVALVEGERAYTEAGNALRTLKAQYDAAGKQTDAYRQELQRLVAQQNAARTALIDLREANRQATQSVTDAVREQGKAETAYKRAATQYEAAGAAVTKQSAALQEAADAARQLGLDTENLAQSEAQLLAVYNRGSTAIEDRKRAVLEMAEADRLAAIEAQGLAELYRRGEAALQAETLAQRDAARAIAAYTAAKEQATADAAAWEREAAQIVDLAESQRRLQAETQQTVEQLRELRDVNAFEQQAREAQRLVQAADYVRFWEQALDDADRKQQELAANAGTLNAAFAQINARSIEDVRAEIAQTNAAMKALADSGELTGGALAVAMARGQERVNALEREIRELTGSLTLADRASGLLKNSLGQIAAGNLIADGVGYLVEKVKEMGRAFIDVTAQTERTRLGLQAIYKNANIASAQFDFLRKTATDAGVSVGAINDAFVRFTAAMQGANQPLGVTNELFAAVTRAGATLGLTGEQVSGALDALGQIASKSTVSMEELRQQLGDRLPGALSLTAKGLGITEAQLIKLVEAGELSARDFFPAFTAALKDTAGSTDTLVGAWGRFVNLLRQGAVAIGDAGGLTLLKAGLTALGAVLGTVVLALQGFIEVVRLTISAVVNLFDALSGNGAKAWADFNTQVEASAGRLSDLKDAFGAAVIGQDQTTAATQASAAAMQAGSAGAIAYAQSVMQVANAESTLGNALIQRLVKAKEDAKAAEAAVVASEKLLKAKTDEGNAMVAAAQLTGNATTVLQANAMAAQANATAAEAVIVARQRELEVVLQSIAAFERERDAQGNLTADRQAAIDKLTLQRDTLAASVEQSRQAAVELQQQAEAARTNAEAYADNATKLSAFQQSMESARGEVDSLSASVKHQEVMLGHLKTRYEQGNLSQRDYEAAAARLEVTKRALVAATNQAARSEALYRDAVADSIKNIDLSAKTKAADLQITQAQLGVQKAHLENLSREAAARGDQVAATQYAIQAKEREIEMMRLGMQIRDLELQAQQAAIEAERESARQTGTLTAEKEKELDIRSKLIEIKQIENGATKESIRLIQQEVKALRERNNVPTGGSGGGSGNGGSGSGSGGSGGGNGGNRNAAGPTQDGRYSSPIENKYGRPTAQSREERLAGQNAVDNTLMFRLRDKLRAGLLTAEDIPELMAVLDANKVNQQIVKDSGAGSFSLDGRNDWTNWQNTMALFQQFVDSQGRRTGAQPINYTVNVGGRRTTVGLNSQADANALTSALRELENQSNTAI